MTLKLATVEDLKTVVSLCKELHSNSVYKDVIDFNEEDTADTVRDILEGNRSKACALLLLIDNKPVGVLVASYVEHMFNKTEKTAVELAFFIKEDYRSYSSLKDLLAAYHYWAKQIGCTSIMQGKLKNKNEVESYTIRRLK